MKMICGTDFSVRAAHATHVAAKLARRFGDSIVLLHAVDLATYSVIPEMTGVISTFQTTIESDLDDALDQLKAKVEGPRLQVDCRVAFAAAAFALSQEAEVQNARMVVVGRNGLRGMQRWLLGSTAEKLLHQSHAPVLVVGPDSTHLEAWATAAEKRPLQALVPIDHSPGSRAMVHWLSAFRAQVAVDITFVHFYEPLEVRNRLNMWSDDAAAVEWVLREHLRKEYGEIPGEGAVTWQVHAIGDSLGHALQTEERAVNADIVIMGTHQRPFLDRLMHTSASRQAVRVLSLPLLCIPSGAP